MPTTNGLTIGPRPRSIEFAILMTLGMNAVHPIQPAAMDIGRMKREHGDRVALAGNIDLDYTLTPGTPEEVDRLLALVKEFAA